MNNATVEIQSLECNLPAEILFQRISDLPASIWLDSSSTEGGRYHLISAAPEKEIRIESATTEQAQYFFSASQALLDGFEQHNTMPGIPFQGGLISYISYELSTASIGVESKERSMMPSGFVGLYLWAIIIDTLNQSQQLVVHPQCNPETKKLVLSRMRNHLNGELPERQETFALKRPFAASICEEDYIDDLSQIDDYIRAGDAYQVNYAQHFSTRYSGNPLDAYLKLRKFAPAPYSGYLQIDNKALLCHSPEQFIEVKGQHARTSPIKGTAPRSGDQRLDRRNAEVLQASEKDRSENLMIVDLMRNDLGKHCVPGSVQTSKLFELKSYSNVHHLVSEIVGELRPENTPLELLSAALPAGSVTGAPKKRAVEIIRELESRQRSFYCGNLGYASFCGNLDFNIGIRSLVADGQTIHCWGGGGIIADSNPTKEYEETLHKVGGLMSELEAHFLALETSEPNQTSA